MLDDATYDGDANAPRAGTVAVAGSALSWAGDVPASGTVTLTYSVTVHNPDTGEHDPGQHDHLAVGGQQLPGRQPRPAVHRHRHGARGC